MAQVQAHLMSHQYEGLLKKANLKGYGPGASLTGHVNARREQ
jgi:preprotein translocase subunit SecY